MQFEVTFEVGEAGWSKEIGIIRQRCEQTCCCYANTCKDNKQHNGSCCRIMPRIEVFFSFDVLYKVNYLFG